MTDKLPSSLEEKWQSFKNDGYSEHWMYVHELRALLDELRPDDWLTPNEVHNLRIDREGEGYIGIIDFRSNEVDIWGEIGDDEDDNA